MDRFRSLLERRSLIAKLVAGFTALLLMILLLGSNSILTAREMSRQAAGLYQLELLGISHIKEANIDLISTGRALRQMALASTFVDRDEAKAQLDQAMLHLDGEMAAVRQSIFRAPEKLVLNELEPELEHHKRNVDAAITLIAGSTDYQKKATAYISGEQFNRIADSADRLLHQMAAIKEKSARETAVAMAQHSRDTQWLTSGLLLGGLLFGTMVAVLTGRAINQSADHPSHPLDNLAIEDVDDTIPATVYRGELGTEEQSTALKDWMAELVQPDTNEFVENVSDDRLLVDEQSAIIAPEHAATISDEEYTRKQFAPFNKPHAAPARVISILIVEDNESNKAVSIGLLATAGCKVTVACSGREALELLEKTPHDIVLMNTQMMTDGIDATVKIRKKTAFDRLPVIAMTAPGIHQDRERCLAAGMNGHIAKPIDPDKLFRALMCWISDDVHDAIAAGP